MKKHEFKIEKKHIVNAVCAVVLVGLFATWLGYCYYKGNQWYMENLEVNKVVNVSTTARIVSGIEDVAESNAKVVSDASAAKKAEKARQEAAERAKQEAAKQAQNNSKSSNAGSSDKSNSGSSNASPSSGSYNLRRDGIVHWGGYRFTWYSQRVLPGGGLNIPNRHVNSAGFVCDGDGYIVAATAMGRGTVGNSPWGAWKSYDTGVSGNTVDLYTNW